MIIKRNRNMVIDVNNVLHIQDCLMIMRIVWKFHVIRIKYWIEMDLVLLVNKDQNQILLIKYVKNKSQLLNRIYQFVISGKYFQMTALSVYNVQTLLELKTTTQIVQMINVKTVKFWLKKGNVIHVHKVQNLIFNGNNVWVNVQIQRWMIVIKRLVINAHNLIYFYQMKQKLDALWFRFNVAHVKNIKAKQRCVFHAQITHGHKITTHIVKLRNVQVESSQLMESVSIAHQD